MKSHLMLLSSNTERATSISYKTTTYLNLIKFIDFDCYSAFA